MRAATEEKTKPKSNSLEARLGITSPTIDGNPVLYADWQCESKKSGRVVIKNTAVKPKKKWGQHEIQSGEIYARPIAVEIMRVNKGNVLYFHDGCVKPDVRKTFIVPEDCVAFAFPKYVVYKSQHFYGKPVFYTEGDLD